jgi:hypothetical protein
MLSKSTLSLGMQSKAALSLGTQVSTDALFRISALLQHLFATC